jgi:hypothetical protein
LAAELGAAMLQDVAIGVALPATLALALTLLAARICRTGIKRSYLPANVAFAGSILTTYSLFQFTTLRPRELGVDWLPYAAIIAGCIAALVRLSNIPFIRWSSAWVLPLTIMWLMLPTYEKFQPVIWYWRIGLALAASVLWICLQLPSEQAGGPSFTFVLAFLSGAAAALLFLAGIAKYAQLAFVMAAVLAGVAVAELIDRSQRTVRAWRHSGVCNDICVLARKRCD